MTMIIYKKYIYLKILERGVGRGTGWALYLSFVCTQYLQCWFKYTKADFYRFGVENGIFLGEQYHATDILAPPGHQQNNVSSNELSMVGATCLRKTYDPLSHYTGN